MHKLINSIWIRRFAVWLGVFCTWWVCVEIIRYNAIYSLTYGWQPGMIAEIPASLIAIVFSVHALRVFAARVERRSQ